MQTLLPFFPEDITLINMYLGVQKKGDTVFYFNGMMPIYQHHKDDYDSFRLFTSQLEIDENGSREEEIPFELDEEKLKVQYDKYVGSMTDTVGN